MVNYQVLVLTTLYSSTPAIPGQSQLLQKLLKRIRFSLRFPNSSLYIRAMILVRTCLVIKIIPSFIFALSLKQLLLCLFLNNNGVLLMLFHISASNPFHSPRDPLKRSFELLRFLLLSFLFYLLRNTPRKQSNINIAIKYQKVISI